MQRFAPGAPLRPRRAYRAVPNPEWKCSEFLIFISDSNGARSREQIARLQVPVLQDAGRAAAHRLRSSSTLRTSLPPAYDILIFLY